MASSLSSHNRAPYIRTVQAVCPSSSGALTNTAEPAPISRTISNCTTSSEPRLRPSEKRRVHFSNDTSLITQWDFPNAPNSNPAPCRSASVITNASQHTGSDSNNAKSKPASPTSIANTENESEVDQRVRIYEWAKTVALRCAADARAEERKLHASDRFDLQLKIWMYANKNRELDAKVKAACRRATGSSAKGVRQKEAVNETRQLPHMIAGAEMEGARARLWGRTLRNRRGLAGFDRSSDRVFGDRTKGIWYKC